MSYVVKEEDVRVGEMMRRGPFMIDEDALKEIDWLEKRFAVVGAESDCGWRNLHRSIVG